VVLGYVEVGFVVEQAVQDVGRVADGGVYDAGVERSVLVRDVGVEGDPAIPPVFRVGLGEGVFRAAGEEDLTVGGGGP
jgi:hypothetical protein